MNTLAILERPAWQTINEVTSRKSGKKSVTSLKLNGLSLTNPTILSNELNNHFNSHWGSSSSSSRRYLPRILSGVIVRENREEPKDIIGRSPSFFHSIKAIRKDQQP